MLVYLVSFFVISASVATPAALRTRSISSAPVRFASPHSKNFAVRDTTANSKFVASPLRSTDSATHTLPRRKSTQSIVAKAQEVSEQRSPVPFIAPPVALAIAYGLVKASPLEGALTGFIEGGGYPEVIRSFNLPEFLNQWFHAINMAIVATAMGGYGTWLGFETKAGRGNEEAWGALNGATKKELHAQLMAGAGLIFAAGGLGGVTFMLAMNKAVFESPHAVTGLAELLLFSTQAALAFAMKQNPELRKAHALLGSITMTILAFHAALGIKLGLGV